MGRRKRGLALVLTALLASALISGASANVGKVTQELEYRDIRVSLDGEILDLRNAAGEPVEPFMFGGTNYLPVRALAESLGLNVRWDGAHATVVLTTPAPSAVTESAVPAALDRIDAMSGSEFEAWSAALLRRLGFSDVSVCGASGDQGVDVLAEKDGVTYAVQCKRYTNNLGNDPVQEVYTGKTFYHRHVGAVLTNRYFTAGAKELAASGGVLLWDRDWIAEKLGALEAAGTDIGFVSDAAEAAPAEPAPVPASDGEAESAAVPASNSESASDSGGTSSGGGNGSSFNTWDLPENQQTEARYVLNTQTMKIHHPDCPSVKKIAPENYAVSNQTVAELEAAGYSRCGQKQEGAWVW